MCLFPSPTSRSPGMMCAAQHLSLLSVFGDEQQAISRSHSLEAAFTSPVLVCHQAMAKSQEHEAACGQHTC